MTRLMSQTCRTFASTLMLLLGHFLSGQAQAATFAIACDLNGSAVGGNCRYATETATDLRVLGNLRAGGFYGDNINVNEIDARSWISGASLTSRGNLSVSGSSVLNGVTNTGGITNSGGQLTQNGHMQVNGTSAITGLTTTNGLNNNGTFNQSGMSNLVGTTGITGATNINTTGGAATTIGTAGMSANLMQGNTNTFVGNANTVTGTTNINTTGGAATTIGTYGTSANLMQGDTNTINGNANTISGTTSINATGGAATTIGTLGASANQMLGSKNTIAGLQAAPSTTASVTVIGQNGSTAPIGPAGLSTGQSAGVYVQGAASTVGAYDVYIASQNGQAAIAITNSGVQIIGPPLAVGQSNTNELGNAGSNTGTVNNNIGIGSTSTGVVNNNIGNAAGPGAVNNVYGSTGTVDIATVSNTFGSGGSGNGGTVTNTLGQGSTGSTIVSTTIGQSQAGGGATTNAFGGGTGTSTNSVGVVDGNGTATNYFGSANSTTSTATNNIGTGLGATTNNIGNTNSATVVGLAAGNSAMNMSDGRATTSVRGSPSGFGASVLPNAAQGTSGGSGIVLRGAQGTYTAVDANGRLTNVNGVAPESTTSMTLTNGVGNTHGVIVTERQATISGGTQSSSLTMNDQGATFSNSTSGRPVQVHGVDNGSSPYDAVNYRQLRQVMAGVAGTAAMANIPAIEPGKRFSVGAGLGHYQSITALALGATYRATQNVLLRGSVSSIEGGGSRNTTAGVGIGYSW